MDYAIVIPAQDNNQYHRLGDLAPFGDTTLLEWKIIQCLDCFNENQIFISTNSTKIENIALSNNLNVIKRDKELDFKNVIIKTLEEIDAKHILWINPTTPFVEGESYKKMLSCYMNNLDNFSSLTSVISKKEFVYYEDNRLNFINHFDGRKEVNSIKLLTNAVCINSKENILSDNELISSSPYLYEVDFLESIESKDMLTYNIINELLPVYFKKELDV